MRKLFITAVAAVFTIGMVSCASINIERESCDKVCKTAQQACIDKLAKDKQGKVSEIKKKACDVAANKCLDECAKKYGAK